MLFVPLGGAGGDRFPEILVKKARLRFFSDKFGIEKAF
jgi:hypothetical protein